MANLMVDEQFLAAVGAEGRASWLFSICRWVARDYRRSAPISREVVVDARHLARAATP
jgi:hypothetical protein